MTRIDLVAVQQRLAQQQPKPATPMRAEPPSWSTRPAPESALRTAPSSKACPVTAAAPAGTLRATTPMRAALPLKATNARAERAEERARANTLRAQIDELNAALAGANAEAERALTPQRDHQDRNRDISSRDHPHARPHRRVAGGTGKPDGRAETARRLGSSSVHAAAGAALATGLSNSKPTRMRLDVPIDEADKLLDEISNMLIDARPPCRDCFSEQRLRSAGTVIPSRPLARIVGWSVWDPLRGNSVARVKPAGDLRRDYTAGNP